MIRPIEECIASRAFAALILDYEFPADDLFPAYVSCRVLVEDLYKGSIVAGTREEAIQKFYNGEY
jgi:hypothetical protein